MTPAEAPAYRPHDASVLYLSHDGVMEPLGASQVLPYVRGLAGEGFRISLLSFEKPVDLARSGEREALRMELGARGVAWHPSPYRSRPPVLAQLLDIARGARVGGRILASMPQPHLIHARSYVGGIMALLLHSTRGTPFVFDTRGLLIDERIATGYWSATSPLVAVLRRVERDLFRRASGVVVVTRRGLKLLMEEGRHPVGQRMRVIPPCTDLERFHPPSSAEELQRARQLRSKLGVGPGPLLVYAGSFSTWYMGRETFLAARGFLAAGGSGFLLLTPEPHEAARLAREAGVDAIIRASSHGEMPGWLQACDAGIALVRPSRAKLASTPIKVGEYLASGLAVATTGGVGDLDAQFRDSPVAFATPVPPPGGWEAVGARLFLAATEGRRQALARALAGHYSLEVGIRNFGRLYRDILFPDPTATGPRSAP